jgi:hypothetical protein
LFEERHRRLLFQREVAKRLLLSLSFVCFGLFFFLGREEKRTTVSWTTVSKNGGQQRWIGKETRRERTSFL